MSTIMIGIGEGNEFCEEGLNVIPIRIPPEISLILVAIIPVVLSAKVGFFLVRFFEERRRRGFWCGWGFWCMEGCSWGTSFLYPFLSVREDGGGRWYADGAVLMLVWRMWWLKYLILPIQKNVHCKWEGDSYWGVAWNLMRLLYIFETKVIRTNCHLSKSQLHHI